MMRHGPALRSGWWRHADRAGLAAAGFLLALMALSAAAPFLSPYAPDAIDLASRRAAPSVAHLFGTDELGRDVCTRVLFGARVSLAVGLVSALVAGIVGALVGAASGYAGGWVDDLLMRVTDAALAMPRLPLLMIAAAVARPGLAGLVLLVGLLGWMEVARLVRAETQSIRTLDFVTAARAAGAHGLHVVLRHVLPLVAPTVLVAATLAVARNILLESALSFFGVGVQPPQASWGNMLYQAQTTMATSPWLALFPGLAILATTLALNLLVEALSPRA